MQYFDDTAYLDFLEKKIQRLQKLLERAEKLGIEISSSGGNFRNYTSAEKIQKQFYEAIAEYDSVYNRIHHGRATNKNIKYASFRL
jgi:hypothetical protein